ncbi:MAG: hypothetical protein ACOYZ6_02020 [Chloroflexota bacterium]
MRNGSLFWGFVLILAGVLYLVGGIQYFWPIVLIGVGVWIIAGAFLRGTAAKEKHVSVDLQGAREMSIKVNHGAGQLSIRPGASMGKALEGECSDNVDVRSRLAGDRLEVRVSGDVVFVPFVWNSRGLDWDLRLSNEIPLSLELETGANQSTVDLSGLRVNRLRVQTGASSTDVTLPAEGVIVTEVQMGAAELKLRIPQGLAARIRSKSGLADISVDTTRFPRRDGGYESPDYSTSPNRVDLTIEAGVGKVSVL